MVVMIKKVMTKKLPIKIQLPTKSQILKNVMKIMEAMKKVMAQMEMEANVTIKNSLNRFPPTMGGFFYLSLLY